MADFTVGGLTSRATPPESWNLMIEDPANAGKYYRCTIKQLVNALTGIGGQTVPASAIVGLTDPQTFTTKSISGSANTITNIGDSAISAGIDAVKIGGGSVTTANYDRLSGVTANVQTQINTANTNISVLNAKVPVLADILVPMTYSVTTTVPIATIVITSAELTQVTGYAPRLEGLIVQPYDVGTSTKGMELLSLYYILPVFDASNHISRIEITLRAGGNIPANIMINVSYNVYKG